MEKVSLRITRVLQSGAVPSLFDVVNGRWNDGHFEQVELSISNRKMGIPEDALSFIFDSLRLSKSCLVLAF